MSFLYLKRNSSKGGSLADGPVIEHGFSFAGHSRNGRPTMPQGRCQAAVEGVGQGRISRLQHLH